MKQTYRYTQTHNNPKGQWPDSASDKKEQCDFLVGYPENNCGREKPVRFRNTGSFLGLLQ